MTETYSFATAMTHDQFLVLIRDGDEATRDRLKGDPRNGGVNRDFLVDVAAKLNISGARRGNKVTLFESIVKRIKNQDTLDQLQSDNDSVDSNASQPFRKFVKDKNTLPRILNILMLNPDAVLRTNLLATRQQLQARETYSNQSIFTQCADRFNDCDDEDIGGLVSEHPSLLDAGINPLATNPVSITAKKIYKYFNELKPKYKKCLQNYERSGQHNQHDFISYCFGDLDLLYLHLWMEKIGNPELQAFCSENDIMSNGVDTAASQLGSSASTTNSVVSQKVSKGSSSNQDLVLELKRRNELLSHGTSSVLELNATQQYESIIRTIGEIEDQISKLEESIEAKQNEGRDVARLTPGYGIIIASVNVYAGSPFQW